jgi:hypothetical protein
VPSSGYTPNRAGTRSLLRSRKLQQAVIAAANRGLAEFRRSARRDTGEYAADAHVEEAVGWDGRVAARIVSDAPGSLSQTFGAYGRRGDPALIRAAAAAGQRPGRGR